MPDAEAAVAEVPAAEEAAVDMPDDEVLVVEPTRATLVEVPSAVSVVPTLAVTAFVEPLPFAPRRPGGIVIRSPPRSSLSLPAIAMSMPAAPRSQDSTVVTELAVVEAIATDAPSPPPVSSTVLTELVVAEAPGAPSAAEGTTSSDDLEELYASLHERLREYIFLRVHQMTTAEAFMEFRSCLDMAMMTEGCSLEQELSVIKDQVQLAMAHLKENDLVIQRENEKLAQVEVEIAELQARRDLILQHRDGAVAVGTELKSSARQILKAATEKKRALAKRKLIRARWHADIDGGDIAWRRITCLIWGMFSEGV
ncbi:unnamed protein product [Prunus armeniaca]